MSTTDKERFLYRIGEVRAFIRVGKLKDDLYIRIIDDKLRLIEEDLKS